MPENRLDRFVKCPFYKRTSPNRIVCESFLNGATTHLVFVDDKDRVKYIKGICGSIKGCGECKHNQILTRMYEVADNDS